MNNIIFLFILFLLTNVLFGQAEKVRIFLKNGSSKDFSVKKVKSWGLLNNGGLGVSFAVIDSITTSNVSLADSIIFQFEGTGLTNVDNEYIIDLSNSKRKIINKAEKPKLVPKSISVYYSTNHVEQIGYKLEYYTGLLDRLCYKMEGSFGFHSSKLLPFNQNFGFGFCYNIKLNDNDSEIGVGLSITNFNDYAKNSSDFKSLWVESLDISYRIPVYERKYLIILDTNIYFQKLDIFDYSWISTIRLGVGLNL